MSAPLRAAVGVKQKLESKRDWLVNARKVDVDFHRPGDDEDEDDDGVPDASDVQGRWCRPSCIGIFLSCTEQICHQHKTNLVFILNIAQQHQTHDQTLQLQRTTGPVKNGLVRCRSV